MNNISIKRIIDISLIVLLLIFIIQNFGSVMVKFLVFGFQLPLIILIAVVFLIGFFTARVFFNKNS